MSLLLRAQQAYLRDLRDHPYDDFPEWEQVKLDYLIWADGPGRSSNRTEDEGDEDNEAPWLSCCQGPHTKDANCLLGSGQPLIYGAP